MSEVSRDCQLYGACSSSRCWKDSNKCSDLSREKKLRACCSIRHRDLFFLGVACYTIFIWTWFDVCFTSDSITGNVGTNIRREAKLTLSQKFLTSSARLTACNSVNLWKLKLQEPVSGYCDSQKASTSEDMMFFWEIRSSLMMYVPCGIKHSLLSRWL